MLRHWFSKTDLGGAGFTVKLVFWCVFHVKQWTKLYNGVHSAGVQIGETFDRDEKKTWRQSVMLGLSQKTSQTNQVNMTRLLLLLDSVMWWWDEERRVQPADNMTLYKISQHCPVAHTEWSTPLANDTVDTQHIERSWRTSHWKTETHVLPFKWTKLLTAIKREDFLFCKNVQSTAAEDLLFSISWLLPDRTWAEMGNVCGCLHRWYTDHVSENKATADTNKEGFSPNVQWMQWVIQRGALASGQLGPELCWRFWLMLSTRSTSEKQGPWKHACSLQFVSRWKLNTQLCFHSKARWLSWGKVWAFEIREVILVFMDEKHMYEAACKFGDDEPLLKKLAYRSDIFGSAEWI